MRNKIKSIKTTYIFIFLAFILLVGAIYIQNEVDNTREEIAKINQTSNIDDVLNLSLNIKNKILCTTSDNIHEYLNSNILSKEQLEKDLQYFTSSKYKDIYLLDKISQEKKEFRVLLDATTNEDDKFLFEESYRPDNLEIYNKVYKTKKAISFENKDIKSLWMTNLYPIIIENKVEAILVVDFSIKELNSVHSIMYELDDIFEIALIFFIFVFCIIVYFTFVDFKREQSKQKAYDA